MSAPLDQLRARAAEHERELSERKLLSIKSVKDMLGMSYTSVRDIPRDELPYGEFGQGHVLKRRRYRPEDIEAYIESRFAVSK